jgi:DNA-binding transcriptional regulator YhcF (GntR family)
VDIILDRSLPVTIAAQIQGQIEYGVAFGTIPSGSRLPSVRALAERLEVSPVTIAHVYKALSDRGVLVTRSGSGTFVRDDAIVGDAVAKRLGAVRGMVDTLIQTAQSHGISRSELQRIIAERLGTASSPERAVRLAFVGNFPEATREYVQALHPYVEEFLAPNDAITALTIGQLRSSAAARAQLRAADVTITLAHRLPEVRGFLSADARVIVLDFIPSESTRTALAELPAGTRVGLVSTYAEFLTPLKLKVTAFAPHVEVTRAAVIDSPHLIDLALFSEVVVFTTGADDVVRRLPEHVRRIEFRYAPDPRSVRDSLVGLLRALRPAEAQRAAAPHGGRTLIESGG